MNVGVRVELKLASLTVGRELWMVTRHPSLGFLDIQRPCKEVNRDRSRVNSDQTGD